MTDIPITEKINAFLEIQGIDLTTAFNHNNLSIFLIECRDEILRLEKRNKRFADLLEAYCNEFTEDAPFSQEFWDALHDKEVNNERTD